MLIIYNLIWCIQVYLIAPPSVWEESVSSIFNSLSFITPTPYVSLLFNSRCIVLSISNKRWSERGNPCGGGDMTTMSGSRHGDRHDHHVWFLITEYFISGCRDSSVSLLSYRNFVVTHQMTSHLMSRSNASYQHMSLSKPELPVYHIVSCQDRGQYIPHNPSSLQVTTYDNEKEALSPDQPPFCQVLSKGALYLLWRDSGMIQISKRD